MKLDIYTLTVVGMLLCSVMAALIGLTLRRFPSTERSSLRIWTVGLALQPLAWTLFSIRGNHPDVLLSMVANFLLVLGYAELARAVRVFFHVEQRQHYLYGITVAVALAIGLSAALLKNFSLLVMLNAIGTSLMLVFLLRPLLRAIARGAGPPERMLAVFALLGMAILGARFIEHLLRPRADGGFLVPATADTIAVMYAAFGPVIVSFGFLLMHQERAYTALQRLATLDCLTGLLNRRAFEEAATERLAAADQRTERLGLLLLDLDHFKQVNDRHGHAAGDRALEEAARRIRGVLRADELAARMGGEELAVLLSGDPRATAERAEQLRVAIADAPVSIGESETLRLTTSIGVACREPGGNGLDTLLSAADRAMYQAKTQGRNRVVLACADPPCHPA